MLNDGIIGNYIDHHVSKAFQFYPSETKDKVHYLDFTLHQNSNIWATSFDNYHGYLNSLDLYKMVDGKWVLVGLTKGHSNSGNKKSGWVEISHELEAGRYKLEKTRGYTYIAEWYIEVPPTEVQIIPKSKDITENKTFTVDVVINNASSTLAEDMTISYNKDFFEYIEYLEVDGISVYSAESTPEDGKIRIITASKGEANALSSSSPVVSLKFKAKASGTGIIDVLNTRVANEYSEHSILDENCGEASITINAPTDVNRNGEFTLIDLAIGAKYYGTSASTVDTTKYTVNYVADETIDKKDLSSIVTSILNNKTYVLNN